MNAIAKTNTGLGLVKREAVFRWGNRPWRLRVESTTAVIHEWVVKPGHKPAWASYATAWFNGKTLSDMSACGEMRLDPRSEYGFIYVSVVPPDAFQKRAEAAIKRLRRYGE